MGDLVAVDSDDVKVIIHRDPSPYSISVTVSASGSFTVPYHFHPTGEEYFTVTKGAMDVVLAGKKMRITPESGDVHIPARVRHGFSSPLGIETVLHERSAPDALAKTRFFEDFLAQGKLPGPLYAMATFYRTGDTYPAIGDWTPDFLGKAIVWFFSGFLGTFLGLAPLPTRTGKKTI